MAKKGVNLLDEDGEEKEPGEEGGEGERSSRRSRGGGGGGGLIRWAIIGVVVVAVLGGGGWAGYKFWWVPSKLKEAERQKAQQKLEELRKERLAKLRSEAEQRKQALAIIEQVQAEQQGKAGGAPPKEGEAKPAAPAGAPKPPAPPAPQMAATAPPKAPAAAKKEEPAKPAPAPAAAPPMAMARPPARPAADSLGKPAARPSAPVAQMRPREVAPEVRPAPPAARGAARPAAPAGGSSYSIQVATCRTDRCVQSFVGRLREKGLESHVSGAAARSGPVNEVLLGSFAARREADGLAGRARAKNLRITVYESGGRWRVSAGSYTDLEDAAQMLDRAEDAGFRGELARRPGSAPAAGTGLRAVRTGSFATRQAALAERAKIVAAGFQGAFVVAEPRR